MGKVVLILGGARSGKSAMAERMARRHPGKVAYVATAEAGDAEMARRIERHRRARPPGWITIEEPLELATGVDGAAVDGGMIVVDCLTLWVSNHLCKAATAGSEAGQPDVSDAVARDLDGQMSALLRTAKRRDVTLLLVSNEVGLGLVPENPLGRAYRDLLGMVNRRAAEGADRVLLMVAGLPIDVKRLVDGGLED